MAEQLDDVVQKILLEGDDEVLGRFEKIAREGSEKFEALYHTIEQGATRMELLTNSLAIISTAVAGVGATLLDFTKDVDEAAQKSIALADAFGTTLGGLQGLEAAFAAGGVSAQVFERFANRLTLSIAQQWPQIAESVRTYATASDAAQERVSASLLRQKEAQNALANSTADFASRSEQNNSRVAATFVALQFAASKALQTMQHDIQSVEAADLSLEQAQQRLDELQGKPVSEEDKKSLEIKQAQLAVDKARQAAADARLAQQQHEAEAAQKQRDAEQAYADARRKQFEDEQQEQLTRVKLENAVREATTGRAEAEERANKLALTSVASITNALQGIVSKNKDTAKSVDLTQVSVVNLERGIINLAAAGSKLPPTGMQTMLALSKVLAADVGQNLIPQTEKLALVQKLAVTSITNTGAATSDLLKVLERGPERLKAFEEASRNAVSAETVHHIKDFNDALAELSLQATIAKTNIAGALSPGFKAILDAMTESLKSSTGFLHLFVEGLVAMAAAVSKTITAAVELGHSIDHALNLEPGRTWQLILTTLAALVIAFGAAWAAIPVAIAAVITAVGVLYDNWDKLKKIAEEVWKSFMDSAFVKWLEDVYGRLKKIADVIKSIFTGPAPAGSSTNENGQNPTQGVEGHAGGGLIHGPGTTTSDSVLARLSRGEFVMKAAAVQNFGTDFMHAVNNMTFPGFATGGLVPTPQRIGGGGNGAAPATSTLNLSIDGRSFNGLRGPKSTIDDLTSYAIARQASKTGTNPSWMK